MSRKRAAPVPPGRRTPKADATPSVRYLVYDASQGRIELPKAMPVVIAGKVREHIEWCDPRVEAAYAWSDRVEESIRMREEEDRAYRQELAAMREAS